MRNLKILVADEQPVVRQGIRHLVESRPQWDVCGEAGNGDEALAVAFDTLPDVAVMAVSLPGSNGITVTRRIVEAGLETRVLLYSNHNDDKTIADGLAAGARGYVLKSDNLEHVENAIEALGARRKYFSPSVTELMEEAWSGNGANSSLKSFTVRELEVTQLIAEGLSNRLIAERLGRSIKTVESHRTAVMRKAGVRSTAGLVRFAIKHRIAEA